MDVIKKRINIIGIIIVFLFVLIIPVMLINYLSNTEDKIREYNEKGKQIIGEIWEYEENLNYDDEEEIRKAAEVLIPLYKQLYKLKPPPKLREGHRMIKIYCDAKIRELQYLEEYLGKDNMTTPEKTTATGVKLNIEMDISNALIHINSSSFQQTGIEIFNK